MSMEFCVNHNFVLRYPFGWLTIRVVKIKPRCTESYVGASVE